VGEGDAVLDVGTGTGALAGRFCALGCRVLGVDLSEEMLRRARQNVPTADLRQLDLLGDWDKLESRRFDAVVSAYVLHEFNLETKLTLLERLMALLKPDGKIGIGDISFETAGARDAARRAWQAVWDEDEHPWVAEDAVPALERLDFGVNYHQVSFCAGVYTLQVPA
jgi:putative AdoMet-dependent methyltransferase